MCLFPVYRFCPSLVDCKATPRSLKLSVRPDLEVREAIEYLFKIREDLERGSAVISTAEKSRARAEKEERQVWFQASASRKKTAKDVHLLAEVRKLACENRRYCKDCTSRTEKSLRVQGGTLVDSYAYQSVVCVSQVLWFCLAALQMNCLFMKWVSDCF